MLPRICLTAVLLITAACTGSPSSPPGVPRPAAALRTSDPGLHAILDSVPLSPVAEAGLELYEQQHPRDFMERVANVAEDSAASVEARYNAVRVIGERGATAWLASLHAALRDPDPRVRAAVVMAAARIHRGSRGARARSLLVAALEDPAPDVQARALDALGDSDLPLLRRFIAGRGGEVAVVARTLLHAAEERGAPLEPDSAGVLRRAVPDGPALEFRPVTRWPLWQAALGTVTITRRTGAPIVIDSVEVVRQVVPVFFSANGRHAVYERKRTIFVVDLVEGSQREVGPGIAPRPRPIANDFIYFREQPEHRLDMRERTRLRYEVLRAPFDAVAAAESLGSVGVFTQMNHSGSYSAARWMRVVEREGVFTLEAENLETFQLPDPFSPGPRP